MGFAGFKPVGGHSVSPVSSTLIRSRQAPSNNTCGPGGGIFGKGLWIRMPDDNQYGPDAYKRLELVKKQLKRGQSEEKKKQAAERRRRWIDRLKLNRAAFIRYALYVILAAVVVGVIVVLVRR